MARYLAAAFAFGAMAIVAGYFTDHLGLSFSGWLRYRTDEAALWFSAGCVIGAGLRFAFSTRRR